MTHNKLTRCIERAMRQFSGRWSPGVTTLPASNGKSDKSGVALLLVIGLISVLMISAVAFSISMRIERQGAFNFRHGVLARHMLWASLSQAINDINERMDNLVYPTNDIFYSMEIPLISTNKARVLTPFGTNYVTADLFERARTEGSPCWHWLWDNGTPSNRIGRYAYIAINQSGLIDANYAGGAVARGGGTNCCELQISDLPEMQSDAQFVAKRTGDGYYETRGEFLSLALGLKPSVPPNNMTVFSLARDDEGIDASGNVLTYTNHFDPSIVYTNKAYIGTNIFLWDSNKIESAFYACGVKDPHLAYLNLLEYADTNSIPDAAGTNNDASLGLDLVEAVPMINEFVVRYEYAYNNSNLLVSGVRLTPAVEWNYPFDQDNTNYYDLYLSYNVTTNGSGITHPAFLPTLGIVTVPVWKDITFHDARGKFEKSKTFMPPLTGPGGTVSPDPGPAGTNISFNVNFSAYIIERASGAKVDQVVVPWDPTNGIPVTMTDTVHFNGTDTITTNVITHWSECLDPRFNHKKSQWLMYNNGLLPPGSSNTLNSINNGTKLAFTGTIDDFDNDEAMFVANRPMSSVGELGYICYERWKTIRLYDHQSTKKDTDSLGNTVLYHKVYDYFTVHEERFVKGLVNVNTLNTNALVAVFDKMPEMEYPAAPLAPPPPVMSSATAKTIADAIIANGPYYSLSELGGNTNLHWASYAQNGASATEIQKESFIRNSAGLLSVRDNCFVIMLAADSYSPGSSVGGAGRSLASVKAVAEVWRDPFKTKNPDGTFSHKCFIRSFRIFDN